MKNRNLIIVGIIASCGFLIIPFYSTNLYCDLFDPTNGGCMRIAGIGGIDYTYLPYFVIDSKHTENPNECWVKEDDGSFTPCKIETGQFLWFPNQPIDSDCEEQCDDVSHFDEKTIKVEGEIADRICDVIKRDCPTFYPGNIQDDGSIMVGFVISEPYRITQYQFFIKNDTLSYDETVIENKN